MRLGDLVAGLEVTRESPGAASVRVCDVTEDSRTVMPGSLFLARAGMKADGRTFVRDAVNSGAAAVLTDDPSVANDAGVPALVVPDVARAGALIAERFYGSPSERLRISAVTGTNGKTTVSFLIWRMLNALDRRCGLIGTVLVDDGREVGRAEMTTPPAIELSRSLGAMVESGCAFASIEASSHALDQHRLDGVRLGAGVFTNLTGDHLDYHRTREAYLAAKQRLFSMLPAGSTAVINADDPAGPAMAGATRAAVVRCSLGGRADANVRVRSSSIRGMRLSLAGPFGVVEADVPVLGAYNAMNVLQAMVAAHALSTAAGLPMERADLERALHAVVAPPGRLEPVAGPPGSPRVFVDFAHSDDSLRNVLGAVRSAGEAGAVPGRLWVVFGCGGDKDRTKRPRMGAAAAELADRVVVTSDNPRSEQPEAIIAEVMAGVPAGDRPKVERIVAREEAIGFAIAHAGPSDIVVIAGKGHETEQISAPPGGAPVARHFDDREVAGAALRARAGVSAGASRDR